MAGRSIIAFVLSYLIFFTNAQIIVHQESFATGLGSWNAVDINDPTDTWSAPAGVATINGFGGSDDEDWLISPVINMDNYQQEYFLFDYFDNFGGNLIELYYSTDYSNGATQADVQAATWTQIPLRILDLNALSCATTGILQRHPAIDISGISGTSVYFAFRYTGTAAASKDYQIDDIRIEAGYYENITPGITCEPLLLELNSLIVNQPERIRYTSSTLYDVWDAILHTDERLNDAGTARIVWDMFTDFPNTTGEFEFDHCTDRDNGSCPGGEGNCYNREHTFPRSWWGSGTTLSDTINTDMHHIYPSDRSLNTVKSNYPPGTVVSPTSTGSNGFVLGINNSYPCTPTTGSKRYFEPIDEYKGDYARTYFYIVTRYNHNISAWSGLNAQGACFMDGTNYPAIQNWALQTLLTWHANDPVSQKEIDRNNAVYAIQGNRNPFIDYPIYANLIWGDASGTPCSVIVLPVELISFEATQIEQEVLLHWRTASERNSSHFRIERSVDLLSWSTIDQIDAAGNSATEVNYMFRDYQPNIGLNYYRLIQVDQDGQENVSKNVSVEVPNFGLPYPNPTTALVHIPERDIQRFSIRVCDTFGRDRTQLTDIGTSEIGGIQIDFSELPAGVYFVTHQGKNYRIIKSKSE